MVNGICQAAVISDILSTCKQQADDIDSVPVSRSVNQHFQSPCVPVCVGVNMNEGKMQITTARGAKD